MKKNALVCIVAKNARAVYPGSVIKKCGKCGQEVYVAPSGQRQLASGDFDIECNDCFLVAMGEEPILKVRVSAEAMQEVKLFQKQN